MRLLLALFCSTLCTPTSPPTSLPTRPPEPVVSNVICATTLPVFPNHGRHLTRQNRPSLDLTLKDLRERKYAEAATAFRGFEGYEVSDDPFDEPFEQFAFKSRWHEAFVGLYQSKFCPTKHNNLYFNPVDLEVPVVSTFAAALLAAIQGDTAGAERRSREILKLDPNFSYALTLLGSLAAAKGDVVNERRLWLAAAENNDHAFPMEEIGLFQRVPIELLLQFKP